MKSGKKIPPEVLFRVVRGIARGMAHLASQNIVHRDLAARNILLDANFEPKVSDFGFSRVVGESGQGKTSAAVGPLRWMPPESLRDKEYSEKSDVWAYAITILGSFSSFTLAAKGKTVLTSLFRHRNYDR
jgi:serine/threonine protein kinase